NLVMFAAIAEPRIDKSISALLHRIGFVEIIVAHRLVFATNVSAAGKIVLRGKACGELRNEIDVIAIEILRRCYRPAGSHNGGALGKAVEFRFGDAESSAQIQI